MKKFAIASTIVATLAVVLMSASYVFAKGPGPSTPQGAPGGYGRSAWSDDASTTVYGGAGQYGAMAGDGILHDDLIAVYASELGLSVDELNARLDAGETLAQIAYAQGLSVDEFNALMANARSQTVADSSLPQAQLGWSQQGSSRGAAGAGAFGTRGAGFGLIEDCPYYVQPAE